MIALPGGCRYMRGAGKFGTMKDSDLVQEITIPALRNDLTQELFREIMRQVPFLHDKDPGELIRSEIVRGYIVHFPDTLCSLPVTPAACLLQHSLRLSRHT
jgi:hypothetical protein